MHTIFIYECSPGRLTLSFVKSDYVRDNVDSTFRVILYRHAARRELARTRHCRVNPPSPTSASQEWGIVLYRWGFLPLTTHYVVWQLA